MGFLISIHLIVTSYANIIDAIARWMINMPSNNRACALCLKPTRSHLIGGRMYCHECWEKLTPEKQEELKQLAVQWQARAVNAFAEAVARAKLRQKQNLHVPLSDNVTLVGAFDKEDNQDG